MKRCTCFSVSQMRLGPISTYCACAAVPKNKIFSTTRSAAARTGAKLKEGQSDVSNGLEDTRRSARAWAGWSGRSENIGQRDDRAGEQQDKVRHHFFTHRYAIPPALA